MRGNDMVGGSLFSYVDLEERVPAVHPLRPARRLVVRSMTGTFWSPPADAFACIERK